MNNLRKSSVQKITYVIGQVLFIFVGVTIAIWFENLNERQKENSFQNELLNEMTLDLENDIKQAQVGVRLMDNSIRAGKKILRILNNKSENPDSISIHMTTMLWYNIGLYNSASYETIKSKGLDLIRNNDLRQKIVQYYEVKVKYLKDVEKVSYNLTWQQYLPNAISKFKNFSFNSGTSVKDIARLRDDDEFKQFIFITIELKGFEKQQYIDLEKSADALMKEIIAQ